MSGGGGVPRSPSAPPITEVGGGFMIGKSEKSGLGAGAGGQMIAAQRMMAKMGWKEGQGLGKQEQVGPGEADDELEEEVGSECAKYGIVTRVLISEITEPNFPAEEAVRIFVQFERPEQTTKAFADLDSRVVCATFYREEKFSKKELAPMPGKFLVSLEVTESSASKPIERA